MLNAAIPAKAAASPLSLGSLAKGGETQAITGDEGSATENSDPFGSLLVALIALPLPPAKASTPSDSEDSNVAVPERTGKTGKILPPALPSDLPPVSSVTLHPAPPANEISELVKFVGMAVDDDDLEPVRPRATDATNGSTSKAPPPSSHLLIEALATRSAQGAEPMKPSGPGKDSAFAKLEDQIISAETDATDTVSAPTEAKVKQPAATKPASFDLAQGAEEAIMSLRQPVVMSPMAAQPHAENSAASPALALPLDQAPISAARVSEVIEAIAQARESGSAHAVRATVSHAEFGMIALRLSSEDGGLSAVMSSADPDFGPAVLASASAGRGGQEAGQSMTQQGGHQPAQQGPSQPSNGQSNSGQAHSGQAHFGSAQSGSGQSPSGQPFSQQHRPAGTASAPVGAEASAATEQKPAPLKARRGILA